MRPMLMLTLCLTAAGASAPPAVFAAHAAAPLEARRKALNDLLAEQWEYNLKHSPEFASILGDKRWNDQLSDFSQQAVEADLAQAKKFLVRFEAVDTTGFPEQEMLNRSLMVRDLREQLDNARFKPHILHVRTDQTVRCSSLSNVARIFSSRSRCSGAGAERGRSFQKTNVILRHQSRWAGDCLRGKNRGRPNAGRAGAPSLPTFKQHYGED